MGKACLEITAQYIGLYMHTYIHTRASKGFCGHVPRRGQPHKQFRGTCSSSILLISVTSANAQRCSDRFKPVRVLGQTSRTAAACAKSCRIAALLQLSQLEAPIHILLGCLQAQPILVESKACAACTRTLSTTHLGELLLCGCLYHQILLCKGL